MSALYPTLEDMKVDQLVQAQHQVVNQVQATNRAITEAAGAPVGAYGVLYPSLDSYMGLEITPQMVQEHQLVPVQQSQIAQRTTPSGQYQVAPITGNNLGVQRAEIKQGVREIILCKDQDGKIGLRIRAINKGIFVAFVYNQSPAALAGLRFGDQILQINGENVAGWDNDKTIKFIKKAAPERITMCIRDRPFERSVTLQKDSMGTLGFVFKDNKITAIVKDSSAARNGVLTEHHMVEINGQNVVGMKEKEIKKIVDSIGRTVTITIVPSIIYDHIVKSIGSSLLKNHMDHSIPDL